MLGTEEDEIGFDRVLQNRKCVAPYFFFIYHPCPGFTVIGGTENIGFEIAPAVIVGHHQQFAGMVT
jgi:hypothetical protein